MDLELLAATTTGSTTAAALVGDGATKARALHRATQFSTMVSQIAQTSSTHQHQPFAAAAGSLSRCCGVFVLNHWQPGGSVLSRKWIRLMALLKPAARQARA